jgi:hypothetical protein
MTLLLAPLLRKTAASNKSGKPRVIITGSDGHVVADHSPITSALSSGQSILEAFNDEKKYVNGERYFQTKVRQAHS